MQEDRASKGELSFATSAYVGGVRDFAKAQQARSAQQVEQIGTLLERSDNQLLLTQGVFTLLEDHASPEVQRKTLAFLLGRSPSELDLPAAIGLARALWEYSQIAQPEDQVVRLLRETINRRIMPAVRETEAGVFLDSGSGKSDVKTDVSCGALLLAAGATVSSPYAEAVGRGLITSALSLGNEKGVLPATLGLNGSRVSSRDGFLEPESIYPILPLARFVPRETSLVQQLGPGCWVWTSARLSSATGSAAQASFVFSYPPGVPYHIVLQGIRPFAQLKLHGIPWHTDPSYFKYSDGWAYDEGLHTLFMKVTGRAEHEEVLIAW
jgi:hypothetical protein